MKEYKNKILNNCCRELIQAYMPIVMATNGGMIRHSSVRRWVAAKVYTMRRATLHNKRM